MSWTFDPSTRLRVCLAVTLALVWGCESGSPSEGPNSAPIQWTSVDSLNETLPSGVQVLAGRNDTIPLRAWAVRVQNPGQTPVEVLLTSGASCPDALLDDVVRKILSWYPDAKSVKEALAPFQDLLDSEDE